jgi:hypothetical protein
MVDHLEDVNNIDLVAEASELERRAMMLAAVLRQRLAGVEMHGASEGDEAAFYRVANSLEQIAEVGKTAIRVIDETDFALQQPAEKTTAESDLGDDPTFQTVCRFVQENVGTAFSTADLRAYLKRHKVDLPDDNKKFKALFAGWREKILNIAEEQGNLAQWADPKLLKRDHYALAVNGKLDLIAATTPKTQAISSVVRLGERDPAIWGEEASRSIEPSGLSAVSEAAARKRAALQLALSSPDIRTKQVIVRFAEANRVAEEDATAIFRGLVKDGLLFTRRDRSGRYYSAEPVEPEAAPRKHTPQSSPESKGLSEKDMADAETILSALASVTHLTQRLTPRELINLMKSKDMAVGDIDQATIKRVVRVLEGQGITSQAPAKQGKKAPRKKRIEVLKVALASQQVKDALKTPEGKDYILQLVRSGELFVAPTE